VSLILAIALLCSPGWAADESARAPGWTPYPAPGIALPLSNRTADKSYPALVGRSISASASWYCKPYRSACTRGYAAAGHYAAAGSSLRSGAWRGRSVIVWRGLRFTIVRLIDLCVCSGIDLYASAFDDLLPLSAGRTQVSVRW
jgi:hypothetical protein